MSLVTHVRQNGKRLIVKDKDYERQLRRIRNRQARNRAKGITDITRL